LSVSSILHLLYIKQTIQRRQNRQASGIYCASVADVCVELKSGTFDDPSPQEEEYLATHGKRGKDWFFNKALRYREGILEAGEMVSVYGRGVREPDPEGVDEAEGYRGLPPMRLRMSGSFDEPLLISDNEATID